MADNAVNIIITATDNASKVIGAISNGLRMITSVVSDITKEYIDYGDQVRELSNFVGTSNEETSRMIQLSDDAFVSFDSLRMASKQLADYGIQPTAENMAQLSDEFLKLNPGVERSQFLLDHFSRAGMDMASVMSLGGDKIREMNSAIDDSMIIDDQKAASIYHMKQELDNFNDAMAGMRYEMAQKLLDIFEAMPQPMKDIVLTLGAVGQAGLLQQLANMAMIISSMGKFSGVGAMLTTIGTGAKSLAVGAYAAMGPVGALAAALALLLVVIDKYGPQAWNTLKMLDVIGTKILFGNAKAATVYSQNFPGQAAGGPVRGGSPYIVGERGPELFVPGASGRIIPNGALAGMGGGNVTVVYSPTISTASQDEIERIGNVVMNAIRRRP